MFSRQKLTGCLLRARPYSRHLGYMSGPNRYKPLHLWSLYSRTENTEPQITRRVDCVTRQVWWVQWGGSRCWQISSSGWAGLTKKLVCEPRPEDMRVTLWRVRGRVLQGTVCVKAPQGPVCGFSKRSLEQIWRGRGGRGQEAEREWRPTRASCLGHWPWFSSFLKWGNWWTHIIWLLFLKKSSTFHVFFFFLNCSGRMEVLGAWQGGNAHLCFLPCVPGWACNLRSGWKKTFKECWRWLAAPRAISSHRTGTHLFPRNGTVLITTFREKVQNLA